MSSGAQQSSPDSQASQTVPAETAPPDDQVETRADEDESLALDHVFDALKNQRRRWVLRYLNEQEGSATMNDLAEHIAALENDTTPEALTSRQRKRVYVGLYQCHLPKMDDIDVIEFDKNRGNIELGPNANQLEQYLTRGNDGAERWPLYYLAVAGGGLATFALLLVLSQLTVTSASVLLGGVLLGVAVLSVAQNWR